MIQYKDFLQSCSECGAVTLGRKTNHWYHCSKWDGVKGRVVKVSTVHVDKVKQEKTDKEV